MSRKDIVSESYSYHDYSTPDPAHQPMYLSKVVGVLRASGAMTILDAGCGDGSFTASLAEAGFNVYGLDLSEGGIARAKQTHPHLSFATASVYDDMRTVFSGTSYFDAIVSVEVIEHLYSPATFVNRVRESLTPSGVVVITTPYWGYFKNVALALTNRVDRSLTALWEGGHIKHWSRSTLTQLFERHGFRSVYFSGAGRRIPFLWNGMVMAFKKDPP
jgi:2-polyprenyl-6-hydroxyphenyl methylase/3-demethylubiquinone-9 3-methyltransferase